MEKPGLPEAPSPIARGEGHGGGLGGLGGRVGCPNGGKKFPLELKSEFPGLDIQANTETENRWCFR